RLGSSPGRRKLLSRENLGDLLHLIVELCLSLLVRLPVADHETQQAHDGDGRPQPHSKTSAQRLHAGLPMRQPTPRTFSITVLPSFLRMPWMRNSMALLCTLSSQPYRCSSSCALDRTAPGRCMRTRNSANSRGVTGTGTSRS